MHFPPEILDIIIGYISDRRATLQACTLVSRAWLTVARRFTFEIFYTGIYPEKRCQTLKKLLASPHTTIPLCKPKHLSIDRPLYRMNGGRNAHFFVLKWYAMLQVTGISGCPTLAQTLFGSVQILDIRDNSEDKGEEPARPTGRGRSTFRFPSPARPEDTPPIPDVAGYSFLQHFTSVTVLELHQVNFDSSADFWDMIRIFAPALKELHIDALRMEHRRDHEASAQTIRTIRFPELLDIHLDLGTSNVADWIHYCNSSPKLKQVTCLYVSPTDVNVESAMTSVVNLLASVPQLQEFTLWIYGWSRSESDMAKSFCEHSKVLVRMTAMTRLTLHFPYDTFSSLQYLPPNLVALELPNLTGFRESEFATLSRLLQPQNTTSSVQQLGFELEVEIPRRHKKSKCDLRRGLAEEKLQKFAALVQCATTRALLKPEFLYDEGCDVPGCCS